MSASLTNTVMGFSAVCSFDAGAVGAFFTQRGFASFVRNGAGDYSLTLSDAYAFTTDAIVLSGLAGATGNVMHSVEVVSSTVLRVRSFASGGAAADVATDIDFWAAVLRVGPN